MDVNAHFNSQFVMIDFELLDNPEFMRFVGSTAFSVYLLLRRYVWRSEEREHSAGLHDLYANGLLTCSVSVATLAEKIGVSVRSDQGSDDSAGRPGHRAVKGDGTGEGVLPGRVGGHQREEGRQRAQGVVLPGEGVRGQRCRKLHIRGASQVRGEETCTDRGAGTCTGIYQ